MRVVRPTYHLNQTHDWNYVWCVLGRYKVLFVLSAQPSFFSIWKCYIKSCLKQIISVSINQFCKWCLRVVASVPERSLLIMTKYRTDSRFAPSQWHSSDCGAGWNSTGEQKVASHLMAWQLAARGWVSRVLAPITANIATLFQNVRYGVLVCPGKLRYHQNRIFRRDAGWKLFPPSMKPLFYTLKTDLFLDFKGCGFATRLFLDFSQYLISRKPHNPIHRVLTAGSNSLLRAHGHVWCLVEFHPVSLSEGWMRDGLIL